MKLYFHVHIVSLKLQALKSEKLSGKLSELLLNLKLSELF